MELESRITHHLNALFENTMSHLFLVELESGPGKITVYIDGDRGVTIDECRKINKSLRSEMADDPEFDTYTLEVSSPGADRPLSSVRQYPQHVGRRVRVKLADGSTVEGRLKELQATGVVLEVGTKKKREDKAIEFEDISETTVMISFN